MSKFDIKNLIEKHTKEDVVDYEAVNKAVTEQSNGINAKTESKFKKDVEQAESNAIVEFLKENNFKGIADFRAFVKNGATEESEKRIELQKEFDAFKESVQDYEDLKAQNKGLQNEKNFIELGVKDTKQQGYLNYQYG